MSRGRIAMREIAAAWLKDPEFSAEYEALEPEFALASALIAARSQAGMTQAQVAEAMGHDAGGHRPPRRRPRQALDPDRERFARAAGTRLRIRFEPDRAPA